MRTEEAGAKPISVFPKEPSPSLSYTGYERKWFCFGFVQAGPERSTNRYHGWSKNSKGMVRGHMHTSTR